MKTRIGTQRGTAGFMVALLSALGAAASCGDSQDQASSSVATHGPPGGILEVDTSSITSAGKAGSAAGGGSSQVGQGGAGSGAAPGLAGAGGADGGAGGSAGGGAWTVGKPCESDLDCPSPLYCREDSLDYIGHRQCTVRCGSSSTCERAFGGGSFCIGAGVCVDACDRDSDCPDQTRCDPAGWCMRSGPGSGVPRCTGPILLCAELDPTRCALTPGCLDASNCSGVALSCYSLFTSSSCTSQDGCYWSSSDQRCSGIASSCSGMHSSYFCSSQSGCHWYESCAGTATQCSKHSPGTCTAYPDCFLAFE